MRRHEHNHEQKVFQEGEPHVKRVCGGGNRVPLQMLKETVVMRAGRRGDSQHIMMEASRARLCRAWWVISFLFLFLRWSFAFVA